MPGLALVEPQAALVEQRFTQIQISTSSTSPIIVPGNAHSVQIVTNGAMLFLDSEGALVQQIPSFNLTSTATGMYFASTSTSYPATFGYYYSGSYWPDSNYNGISQERIERYQREQKRKKAENLHRAKAAIRRALKLMDNVGFGNEVSVFLGGNSVEVSHPDSMFKFVMKKNHSIISRTVDPGVSTPYELSLYTKSDVYVARLCVLMEKTPVLDQVLALSMFIQTGDEEHILSRANWFELTKDEELREIVALYHPEYRSKLKLGNRIH